MENVFLKIITKSVIFVPALHPVHTSFYLKVYQ